MEHYALFDVLKQMFNELSSDFTYTYNDMDSNKGYKAGIYIKGAEASKYRELSSGEYINSNARVQVLIQGDLDKVSMMACESLGFKIKKALTTTYNRELTTSSNLGINSTGDIVLSDGNSELEPVSVTIIKVDILGDVLFIGKSEQGRPRYSINMKAQYVIGGIE